MDQTKTIKLLQLTLTNFKGEQLRVSNFDGGFTTISGRNGLGKSRHLTAFLWLITGKDQFDRDNYEIKTRVDGNELHNVVASVEGVFDVSGKRVTLKRAMVENWVKPRGCTESEFKGNKTECWYDGTPVSVKEYNERVTAIFGDPTLFKLLTNPDFFPSLPWQKQREQLIALAGEIDESEIAKSNEGFAELLDRIGGKSFEDYKKTIASRKKQIKDELVQIQPRIDQTEKMKPAELDWAGLEKSIKDVESEIEGLSSKIDSCGDATRVQAEIVREIANLRGERSRLIREAEVEARRKADDEVASARNAYYKREEERREVKKLMDNAELDAERLLMKIRSGEGQAALKASAIERKEAERAQLRADWREVSGEVFADSMVCPTCGQDLPEEEVSKAREKFEAEKARRISEINLRGRALKSEIEAEKAEYDKIIADNEKFGEAFSSKDAEIGGFRARLAAIPSLTYISPATVNIVAESVPGVSEIDEKIVACEKSIDNDPGAVERGYKAELSKRTQALRDLQRLLSGRETIENLSAEIKRLQGEGKRLSGDLADVEREEFLIAEFTKAKCDIVEKGVNKMFSKVKFQLFDKTLDGNIFETCRILVDGVLYPSANTASQINAGLDILGVLSNFYETKMPVFIDGAERANNLDLPSTQCILLRVSNEDVLTITPGPNIY